LVRADNDRELEIQGELAREADDDEEPYNPHPNRKDFGWLMREEERKLGMCAISTGVTVRTIQEMAALADANGAFLATGRGRRREADSATQIMYCAVCARSGDKEISATAYLGLLLPRFRD
jgi:hypothetical protein